MDIARLEALRRAREKVGSVGQSGSKAGAPPPPGKEAVQARKAEREGTPETAPA